MLLDLIWTKIEERFHFVAAAFRSFDLDINNNITLGAFETGLDNLRIKISSKEVRKIFNYLDQDQDGGISYNEFCALCEEKRRKIDPFDFKPRDLYSLSTLSHNKSSISNLKHKIKSTSIERN